VGWCDFWGSRRGFRVKQDEDLAESVWHGSVRNDET